MFTPQRIRVPGQSWVTRWCRSVSRLFVVGSLLILGLAGAWMVSRPGADVALLGATTPSGSHEALGLSYEGAGGLALLAAQAAGVVLASLAAWRGRGRVRKIGLLAVLAWCGLWLANAVWLAGVSDQFMRLLGAWVLTGAFAATVVRTVADWPRGAPALIRRRGRVAPDALETREVDVARAA